MAPHKEFDQDEIDNMTVGQKIRNWPSYVKHQIISLKPPGEMPTNPYTVLRMLNRRQWAFWFIGFLGWSWVLPPFPLFRVDRGVGCIRFLQRLFDRFQHCRLVWKRTRRNYVGHHIDVDASICWCSHFRYPR